MNESLKIPPSPHRLWAHFCGSSPTLRILAWLAVSGLLLGWVCFALMVVGFPHRSLGAWWAIAHLGAFVLGLSSCCALGGISAASVLLTFLYALLFAGGGASC